MPPHLRPLLVCPLLLLFLAGCSGAPKGQIARAFPGSPAATSGGTTYASNPGAPGSPGYGGVAPTPPRDPYHYPDNAPQIYADSAIMIDARSGEILFYKNPDKRGPVASTQKLLTALLIVERGGLNGRIRIERSDTYAEPSKLYLKTGDVYTREQLLNAILIKSANDAAEALARDAAGSRAAFAQMMNHKASELGLRNTRFVNPHGLPAAGQYSSARQMAKVAYHAYRNRTIRDIVRQKAYRFRYADGRVKVLENTNKLLDRFPLCNGMKTGYTHASGKCLISSASYGGREVILVQLGSKSKYLWDDSQRLLTWGLRRQGANLAAYVQAGR